MIDAGWTGVSAKGVEAIVHGKHTGPLTALNLMSNVDIDYDEPADPKDREEGVAVAETLAASKALGQLRELVLNYRSIGDEGVKILANALKAFPALRRLHLAGCGLTMKGAKALAESALGGQLLCVNLQYNVNLLRHHAKLKKMFPNAHVRSRPSMSNSHGAGGDFRRRATATRSSPRSSRNRTTTSRGWSSRTGCKKTARSAGPRFIRAGVGGAGRAVQPGGPPAGADRAADPEGVNNGDWVRHLRTQAQAWAFRRGFIHRAGERRHPSRATRQTCSATNRSARFN